MHIAASCMHLLSSISVISYSDEPGSKRILKESFVIWVCVMENWTSTLWETLIQICVWTPLTYIQLRMLQNNMTQRSRRGRWQTIIVMSVKGNMHTSVLCQSVVILLNWLIRYRCWYQCNTGHELMSKEDSRLPMSYCLLHASTVL